MKATVTKIVPSPSGLGVALRIQYGKDGPIRFASVSIPWDAFGSEARAEILHRFDRLVGDTLAAEPEEPLPLDWA